MVVPQRSRFQGGLNTMRVTACTNRPAPASSYARETGMAPCRRPAGALLAPCWRSAGACFASEHSTLDAQNGVLHLVRLLFASVLTRDNLLRTPNVFPRPSCGDSNCAGTPENFLSAEHVPVTSVCVPSACPFWNCHASNMLWIHAPPRQPGSLP